MRAPSIRSPGTEPGFDGDINLYIAPEAQSLDWFDWDRRVIFVNGMANSPTDHAGSARALSLLQGCPVIGVYNKSDGLWPDLGQCITDKAALAGIQAQAGISFDAWVTTFNLMFWAAAKLRPRLTKVDFMAEMIEGNPATKALFGLLAGDGGVHRIKVPIYCHSQGNLVTSNALTAVALALGPVSIAGVEVNGFGSPCRYWPPGLARTNNAFTFDPISWLDLRVDDVSAKVGFVAGHAFTLYMERDAEFVVNRFRYGSFSMTMDMDEEGLAKYMVRIGMNPPRLKRIFEHLRQKHFTDSDDVALAFVQRAPMRLLRSLKLADPSVINLIIELLGAGWTAGDEQDAIDLLKRL
jgi:hypothetical protein